MCSWYIKVEISAALTSLKNNSRIDNLEIEKTKILDIKNE